MGELPDFPFLPELPGRGPGASIIGRTASLLLDMPVETTVQGWKLADRPGRDVQRASSFLSFDLDAMQQAADGYAGVLKVAVCGPLTLAAQVELKRSQNPALADPGALADLAGSLAEGVAAHLREVRERVPGATVVVQFDEPALPAVLAGRVPTASGLNMVRALDESAVRAVLGPVLEAMGAFTVVHCCAEAAPFLLIRDAGAQAVSFDLAQLRRSEVDAISELAEGGLGLLVGAVPAVTDPAALASKQKPPEPRATAGVVIELWRRTSIDPRRMAEQVVITPACGLAGASPARARATLAHCREAAHIAPEMAEEGPRE
jgi:methionine synthase II (cobalamin-independent)